MKLFKPTWFALTTIIFLSSVVSVRASIYTFDGTITSAVDSSGSGLIAAAGLSVGTPVTYSIELDFALDGTFTQNGGGILPKPDTATLDFFFADYVAGNALPVPASPAFTAPTHVAEYNHAMDHLAGGNSIATVNSQNNLLSITVLGGLLSDLMVGDSVRMDNRIWFQDAGLKTAFVVSNNMTLTGISTSAVPEAASLAIWCFLGTTGFGCCWWRRRSML